MSEKLRRIRSIGLFLLVLCASIVISTPMSQEKFGTEESSKKKFYLTRTYKSNTVTLGAISLLRDGRPLLRTLEPPQRIRKPRTIPVGTYVVEVLRPHGTGQPRLRLLAVVGFSGVYLEVGNFPHETRGCILVGLSTEGEGLRDSRKAFQILLDSLGSSKDFILVIRDSISDESPANMPTKSPIQNDTRLPVCSLPTRRD